MEIIRKRTGDWWFFTFLPLIVFGIIIFWSFDQVGSIFLLFTQQLFFFSLILSSTEIGLRFRVTSYQEEENKFKVIWPSLLILIASALLLIGVYLREDIFNKFSLLLFGVSILCTIGSIWLSNQNIFSGIPDFEEQRKMDQKKFSKKVSSSQDSYKEVKIE